MALPRSWIRLLVAAALVGLVSYSFLLYGRPTWLPSPTNRWPGGTAKPGAVPGPAAPGSGSGSGTGTGTGTGTGGTGSNPLPEVLGRGRHPIDDLIEENRLRFKTLMGKRSTTLEQAAWRYRERRGRHPPPGFDAWFAYARDTNAVVVEEFFDRVYQDLAPLWALDPATMRRQTHAQPQLIRVRRGEAFFETDNPHRPPWIQEWTKLVKEIAAHLPDLDMVVNVMDETRLLVPWETVSEYVETEAASRARALLRPLNDTVAAYSGLADVDVDSNADADADAPAPYAHSWITNDANRFWDHLRAACPPGSPARDVPALETFSQPLAEFPTGPNPNYTRGGFVANATAARDPCLQPHLRGMHGTFVESVSMSTSHELLPMFAGCKLPQNNEILIPGAMYLTDDPFYSGGRSTHNVPWSAKSNGMVWRGTASGGRNKADNWWHFHRHRWVQMTNGSTVSAVEAGLPIAGPTFRLPAALWDAFPNLTAHHPPGTLGAWLQSFANVGFVDLECFPAPPPAAAAADASRAKGKKVLTCDYTSPHMAVLEGLPMKLQYYYKYLPDVDGNSYSARWRSFLRSTSLPLKATIYAEWHDDRLVPWVHYVPFDSTYLDLYAVMDYFLDVGDGRGHDPAARRIAEEGRDWAEAVLRREDMQLYVWRLLLEYARVVDDQRDRLAFVADLVD